MSLRSLIRHTALPATLVFGSLAAASASAAQIDWASYSNVTPGQTGSAALSFSTLGVTATYSGEIDSLDANYPSYTPVATFSGGAISNAPPSSNGIVHITGGAGTGVNTITFSQAILNPVLAIWSLGQGGATAEFVFDQPVAIQSGGPNAEYGGSTITQVGNIISGNEGNGTVEFLGTFTSISWTNPEFENYYGFTVGATAIGNIPSAVPEPGTYALMLAGLGVVGFLARRRRQA